MSRHTPGPWEESGSGSVIRTKTRANERGGLSGGVLVAQFWTRPEPADARLMAAAPELLEALQNAAGLFDSPVARRRHDGDPMYSEVVASIRAAIAKAEGQS